MVLALSEVNKGVPFTGTTPRFSLVSDRSSTWIYHRGTIDGTRPKTLTIASKDFQPVVTSGRAEFAALTGGGLFSMVANQRLPMILEALDVAGGASFVTVKASDMTTQVRALDATKCPYELGPDEVVKATGGTYAGILVRLIEAKIL